MNAQIVVNTDLPLPIVSKGKVRDIYSSNENLLLVATDRISAFDVVLPDPIPSKGVCLTQLSKFWFDYTKDVIPNQVISTEVADFPKDIQRYKKELAHRSMLVKKTKAVPIECIVRGYLSGSAWGSYQREGTVCGIKLPKGLKESDRFDKPLFTPSTKAKEGHDLNISFEEMARLVGRGIAKKLQEYSLTIYITAVEYARKRGIIIADTKFEFGLLDDELIWIDEALTPDSSRFWPADQYEPGRPQPSFDKQYVRDYLISTGWDKNSAPPRLPQEVVAETTRKYQEAYEKITGKKFLFK
ncbi:MAG TPA: phosphoribosylaminoimidazolesuccinocarboxamide synthase [Candidatus Thermoplasmatota archaeon]|nr:phosphoribosylaminoimidazolesuccinocarboxamide synthase [Candidatus Thermoplasmatota archaeon]